MARWTADDFKDTRDTKSVKNVGRWTAEDFVDNKSNSDQAESSVIKTDRREVMRKKAAKTPERPKIDLVKTTREIQQEMRKTGENASRLETPAKTASASKSIKTPNAIDRLKLTGEAVKKAFSGEVDVSDVRLPTIGNIATSVIKGEEIKLPETNKVPVVKNNLKFTKDDLAKELGVQDIYKQNTRSKFITDTTRYIDHIYNKLENLPNSGVSDEISLSQAITSPTFTDVKNQMKKGTNYGLYKTQKTSGEALKAWWESTKGTANTLASFVAQSLAPYEYGKEMERAVLTGNATEEAHEAAKQTQKSIEASGSELLQKGAKDFMKSGEIRQQAIAGEDILTKAQFDIVQNVPDMAISALIAVGTGGTGTAAKMTVTQAMKQMTTSAGRKALLKQLAVKAGKALIVTPETIPLALKSFAMSYQDNLSKGMDDGKALTNALVKAYGEGLLEKGGVQSFVKAPEKGVAGWLASGGFEGSEEITQDIWSNIIDRLYGQDVPILSEDSLYSGLIGAITGWGIGAPMIASNSSPGIKIKKDSTMEVHTGEGYTANIDLNELNAEQLEVVSEMPVVKQDKKIKDSVKEMLNLKRREATEGITADLKAQLQEEITTPRPEESEKIADELRKVAGLEVEAQAVTSDEQVKPRTMLEKIDSLKELRTGTDEGTEEYKTISKRIAVLEKSAEAGQRQTEIIEIDAPAVKTQPVPDSTDIEMAITPETVKTDSATSESGTQKENGSGAVGQDSIKQTAEHFKKMLETYTLKDVASNNVMATDADVGILRKLKSVGDIKPNNSYYTTNSADIQLSGVTQTDLVDGVKYVYSSSPLSVENMQKWSLAPVYEKTPKKSAPKKTSSPHDLSLKERDNENVGDRRVKAIQEIHPELSAEIQEEAGMILFELDYATKGERYPIKDEQGYTIRWEGVKKDVSNSIQRIQNTTEKAPSYENIRAALNSIIEGKGNDALAKRIELVIDDNLSNGTVRHDGTDQAPNANYLIKKELIEKSGKSDNMKAEGDKNVSRERGTESGSSEADRGRVKKEAALRKALQYLEGAGVESINAKITDGDTLEHRQVQRILEELGIEVVFYEADTGLPVSGVFDPSLKNTVFIRSSDARNMMWAAGHEFFHTLKVNHSDLYKAVIEIYKGMITSEQKAQYLKTFDKTPNLQDKLLNDENLLIEEMLADEAGNTITSESFWERVMEKSRNLFEKLASLVRELLSKMTRLEYVNYLDKEQISQFGKDFETIITAVRSRIKEGEAAENLEFMDELPFSAREKVEKEAFDKASAGPYNVNGGVDNGRRTEGSGSQVAGESIEVRAEANRQVEIGRVYRQRNSGVAERLRVNGKDVPSTSYVLYEDIEKVLIQKGKDLTEIHSVSDPGAFSDAITAAKKENPHGAYVTAHTVDEYSKMKTFLTRDGHSGIAVTDDGDIVSAFNNGSKSKIRGGATQLLIAAIENGGKKLDNFDGKLSDIYAQHGFIPVARTEFSTDQSVAPSGWNYERDNHPDIIFWVHNGDSPETVAKNIGEYRLYSKDDLADLPLLKYSKAATYRDNLLSQRSDARYTARNKGERQPVKPFYSKLQQTIEQKMPNKASVEQVQNIIKSGGIKADEVKWSGIDDFLRDKKSVTKQEILDYLRMNELQIEEVTKGDDKPIKWERMGSAYFTTIKTRRDNFVYRIEPLSNGRFLLRKPGGLENSYATLDEAKAEVDYIIKNNLDTDDTKYAQYTLPGGENYRELLFTLPTNLWDKYKSAHWEEPNVLAHTRFNDRIDADGNKVFFVEEVQSDLHQEGRRKGYKGDVEDVDTSGWKAEKTSGTFNGKNSYIVYDENGQHISPTFGETELEAIEYVAKVAKENKLGRRTVDAPFAKTWHEFVLKRMIRYAAENGYDKIAWTTGEQQNARYQLSEVLDELQAFKKADGTYWLTGKKDEKRVFNEPEVPGDKLESIIGKEMAQKIASGQNVDEGYSPQSGYMSKQAFKGIDLKVGGEGMKGFYDKIIPEFLNKYGKKWGAKVETSRITMTDKRMYSGGSVYDGPELTAEDLEKLLVSAPGNQYISPFTGQRMMFPWNRVAVEQPVKEIISYMNKGMSFKDAIEDFGNMEIAELIGGELKSITKTETLAQPSMTITPAMHESVMYEGQPLYTARDREERGLSRKVEPQFDERISTEPPEDIRKKYIGEFHTVSKDKESDFNLGDFINKVYDKAFDNKQELNRFGKAFGQKPNGGLYAKALASMMSDKQARIILTKRMIDAKGDEIGKSLKEILKPVRKDKKLMQVLDDYLVYKHAPSWMEKGRVVFAKDLNITIEEVNGRAQEIELVFPELVQIQKDIVEFQRQLAQAWLVDTGVLSAEAWRQFQKEYPDYVPLMRSFAAIEGKGGYRPKSGYVNQGSPIKSGKGSERDIINPIESIIEHVGQYTKVARRNEAGQSFLDIVRSNKENLKGVAEELWPELIMLGGPGEVVTTQVLDSQGNVIETMYFEKILEEDGLDGVVEKMQRLYQFQDEGAGSILGGRKGKGKVVTVLKDGKPVHVEVFDESLLNALMSITPRQQLAVVKALGSVTKTMKTLTTGMNLSFGIARNLWNDLVTGYVSSKTINANPLLYFKYIADLTAAAGDIIAESLDGKLKGGLGEFINNAAEKYKLYENVGGGAYASSVSADVKHLMRAKKDVLSEMNVADYIIGTLETINNTLETAPRLAEFKRMIIKEGNTHEGRSKAMYEANDLTVNFSRFGDDVKAVDNGVPFLNAAVQGIDKTVRIYKDNPMQAIMKSVWAVTIPTIILYCMNNRDDEHEKAYNMLSNYTKDNYFLIPYTDSEGIKYFKIPKGREIGIIWGAMPERIMRLFAKHDPEAFKDYANNVWNVWSPPDPVTDNILFPAYRSLILGKNWRFQDLESYAEQFESPQYRYSESTSGVAKTLGKVLNMSPKRLDDFFKSYLGGIAQYGIPLTSEKGGTAGKTFVQQVTVDPVYSTDALNNFYALRNELTTKHTDQKSGNYVMTAYEYSLYQQFNKIADSLSTYRKYINATSDPKEKRAYRKQMNELAMEVYGQGKALLEEERKE